MERPARTLIVGASGLVGSCLLARFGAEALGTYHEHASDRLVRLDVTDARSTRDLLERVRPQVVIHCAAWTHVDGCELDPERSRAINVEGVRNIAMASERVGARVVFFSTDYVFGGEQGPHATDEEPAPMNVYGQHKLEGERILTEAVTDHAIIRSCNLYAYQPHGKNFVMAVLRNGRAGRTMQVAADQWGSPTLADDLAEATIVLSRSEERGIFHLAGPDYVDRREWALRAAATFGLGTAFVNPVRTRDLAQPAPRPLKGGLDSRDSCERLRVAFCGLDEGLRAVAAVAAQS